MNTWERFVDSLSSKGAAILLLLVCCFGLCLMVIHIMHHGDKNEIATTVVGTFSGFCGALLMVLSSQGKAQNGNENSAKPPDSSQH